MYCTQNLRRCLLPAEHGDARPQNGRVCPICSQQVHGRPFATAATSPLVPAPPPLIVGRGVTGNDAAGGGVPTDATELLSGREGGCWAGTHKCGGKCGGGETRGLVDTTSCSTAGRGEASPLTGSDAQPPITKGLEITQSGYCGCACSR
jgi:hypothetical protein